MGVVMDLMDQMKARDWLRLLGQWWSSFDNVCEYQHELYDLLPYTPYKEMMTLRERRMLAALPDVITIYRGCGPHNADGICWSLDRDIAASLPFKGRYLAAEPMLITATVNSDEVIAYKHDRGEREIITFYAQEIKTERLRARSSESEAA